MSVIDDNCSISSYDSVDHQNAETLMRPTKKQKVTRPSDLHAEVPKASKTFEFEPLLHGYESLHCLSLREKLFSHNWAVTEARIQEILNSTNEKTVEDISSFVLSSAQITENNQIPSGFVVTGPNISSQELLVRQISNRLKSDINGPVVTIRSADASNLKSVIIHLIRDATIDRTDEDTDEIFFGIEDGRKLLNYDFKILQKFVKRYESVAVTIVLQDSEAFDTTLLAELITLLSSWRDRIPFVLIIGIATTIDLFSERIPRAASRCLTGMKFEIEQTSSLLERIFLQVVAGAKAPLRLSPDLISAILDRQDHHLQSIQSFVSSVKYAYICHYYFDCLSILNIAKNQPPISTILQPEHLEAIRMLPSFRNLIERETSDGSSKERLLAAKSLLTDDKTLLDEVERLIDSKDTSSIRLLRAIHVLTKVSLEPLSKVDAYLVASKGCLGDSDFVCQALDSIKRLTPKESIDLISRIMKSIHDGAPEMDLAGWDEEDSEFVSGLSNIKSQVSKLEETCLNNGTRLRSSYAIHTKGIRTTVVAQRVQLSYETSSLSEEDKEFTSLIDQLTQLLLTYFSIPNPQTDFLSEAWTFDSLQHFREVFTPRPRAALERALSAPSDYLNEYSDISSKGVYAKPPATAILYQMYLESGSLINLFDLWCAFSNAIGAADDPAFNEREALVLFYRTLADLKMLGMVKQSKRKVDHLNKLAWKGL